MNQGWHTKPHITEINKSSSKRRKSRASAKSASRSNPKRNNLHKLSKFDFSTVEFINFLAEHNVVEYKWKDNMETKLFKKIRGKAENIFTDFSNTKESLKIKLIADILSKQTQYQEEALTSIVNKSCEVDQSLTLKKMAQSASEIMKELMSPDLEISNTSIEEESYYENYDDPEFQKTISLLRRLCKRERMLVTILNKRIAESESEKDNAEQALVELMQKSSVHLCNTSNMDESEYNKNCHRTVNNMNDQKDLEFTVSHQSFY